MPRELNVSTAAEALWTKAKPAPVMPSATTAADVAPMITRERFSRRMRMCSPYSSHLRARHRCGSGDPAGALSVRTYAVRATVGQLLKDACPGRGPGAGKTTIRLYSPPRLDGQQRR